MDHARRDGGEHCARHGASEYDTVGAHRNFATRAAACRPDGRSVDDRCTGDRSIDYCSTDDRCTDDRCTDDRNADDRSTDDRSTDDRSTDDRNADDCSADDAAHRRPYGFARACSACQCVARLGAASCTARLSQLAHG